MIGIEPHPAETGEISTVISKRRDAMEQLRPHLKPGARIAAWLWVATGENHFVATESARRRLEQNGIRFVGKIVRARDLDV